MIVHIVAFKFKDGEDVNIQKIKNLLEALPQKIKEIVFLEVGVNFSKEERAMDMSLITHFETKEDLSIYAVHPDHLEVVALIKQASEYTKVVDYEKL